MTDDVRLDLEREDRIGIPEAVLAGPKTVDQLERILDQVAEAGRSVLLTRLRAEQFEAMSAGARTQLDYDVESETAFFGPVVDLRGEASVAVVCAGTSDRRVASEVERTLRFAGLPCLSVNDVGVAGLWRLTERLGELSSMRVLIVVAGMEGALPTVVAGLVPSVVIAVPTSVGYGVSAGGHVALNSALSSCAPGVLVVNIDNGYGAASAAIRILTP